MNTVWSFGPPWELVVIGVLVGACCWGLAKLAWLIYRTRPRRSTTEERVRQALQVAVESYWVTRSTRTTTRTTADGRIIAPCHLCGKDVAWGTTTGRRRHKCIAASPKAAVTQTEFTREVTLRGDDGDVRDVPGVHAEGSGDGD